MTSSTIKVRPLSYDDVECLRQRETIEAYRVEDDGLVPVTLNLGGSPSAVFPYYERTTNGRTQMRKVEGPDAKPLGYRVPVDTRTAYGMESGDTLYTSAEAATEPYEVKNTGGLRYGRREYVVADEDGQERPLAPVYGSQVSLTMFLAGVDHAEAKERALAALAREFGDDPDLVRVHRPSSRPVRDERVDVYARRGEKHEERLVAVNVLAAEATYYANANSYRTVTHVADDEGIVVGPGTRRIDASGRKGSK